MQNLGARAAQAASWIRPELLAIDAATIESYMQAECLQHYQLQLERVLRYRPHTLGEKEEELLAMQAKWLNQFLRPSANFMMPISNSAKSRMNVVN